MNLKPYLDAVQTANEKVRAVAMEIDTAFTEGTEEGTQKALAMRTQLDDAQAKAQEAQALYESMKLAEQTDPGNAARFAAGGQAASQPKKVTRAEFDAMEPLERGKFIRGGGQVFDPAE